MADRQSVERGDFELSHETVKTYADDEYKKVRERWQLGDDFLGGFDFAELKEGGGKGGNLMGFTKDKQYLARVRRDRVKIRARRFPLTSPAMRRSRRSTRRTTTRSCASSTSTSRTCSTPRGRCSRGSSSTSSAAARTTSS